MDSLIFSAPEYQKDGIFKNSEFHYKGDETKGWQISRNGDLCSELGPGYTLVKTLYCGICSTDLARRFLPYPLPQVIGHEIVGLWQGKTIVSEINASHLSRGLDISECVPCQLGMDSHCPGRTTLGIDRLPGGFAPFFLAPVNAIIEVPESIPNEIAALTEPLAAALQAVKRTPPRKGDSIAVLGPRRLGSLIIAALADFRRRCGYQFTITALVRHQSLEHLCTSLGADQVINVHRRNTTNLKQAYDIVYDTSGTSDGFIDSLKLAKRVLHLKSTNGQQVLGLEYLTEMVVDEIGLMPFSDRSLSFSWLKAFNAGEIQKVFVTDSVAEKNLLEIKELLPKAIIIKSSVTEAFKEINQHNDLSKNKTFSQVDVAVVTNLDEVNRVIRPSQDEPVSLVRPRGSILLADSDSSKNELLESRIKKNKLEIHTSRCGDFNAALEILSDNQSLVAAFQQNFITQRFPLKELEQAFQVAANSSDSIKVLITI